MCKHEATLLTKINRNWFDQMINLSQTRDAHPGIDDSLSLVAQQKMQNHF